MKVITISRIYGAGGHSVGNKVAEKLGIGFYDKDIMKATALAMGIDPDTVKNSEEHITKGDSFLRAITPISYDYKNTIFNYERDVILKVASEGPCVILGRCAGEILKEEGIECLNILLFADNAHCARRIGELLNTDDENVIAKEMKRENSSREAFFNHYTGKHLQDTRNWHMTLDTGALGYDTCVRIICEAAR